MVLRVWLCVVWLCVVWVSPVSFFPCVMAVVTALQN